MNNKLFNRLDKFTIVDVEIIKKLSLPACGFYTKLCTLTHEFEFSVSNLANFFQMSEKKIRIFTKELVDKKVLLRVARKKNKFFAGWDWILNPATEDFEKFKDPCELQRKSACKKMKVEEKKDEVKVDKIDKKFYDFKNRIIKEYNNKYITNNLSQAPNYFLFVNSKNYLEFHTKDKKIIKIDAKEAVEIWQYLYKNQQQISKFSSFENHKKDDIKQFVNKVIIIKTNNVLGKEEDNYYKIVDIIKTKDNLFKLKVIEIDKYNNYLSNEKITENELTLQQIQNLVDKSSAA